ncbi:MAG: helix-turn-helix transcriptional regulator, partial [Clostridia bacterium]|nr:helix-turn-helix transcriptional regulator [Clostridia bacterium]
GVKRQTISMYETDKRDLDLGTLKSIAIFFDITVDELLEDVPIKRV